MRRMRAWQWLRFFVVSTPFVAPMLILFESGLPWTDGSPGPMVGLSLFVLFVFSFFAAYQLVAVPRFERRIVRALQVERPTPVTVRLRTERRNRAKRTYAGVLAPGAGWTDVEIEPALHRAAKRAWGGEESGAAEAFGLARDTVVLRLPDGTLVWQRAPFDRAFDGRALSAALVLLVLALASVAAVSFFARVDPTNATLHEHAREGRTVLVRILLWTGADPDQPGGRHGDTPLILAAQRGDVAMIELLLDHGADVNRMSVELPSTPLTTAIRMGKEDAARALLARGADVNARHPGREGPLNAAIGNGRAHLAELLLDAGADPAYLFEEPRWESQLRYASRQMPSTYRRLLEKAGRSEP